MRTRSLAFFGCRTLTTEIASCTSVPAVQRARLCSSEARLAKSQYLREKLVSHGFTTPVHLLSSMHAPHAARPFNSPFQYPLVCIQRSPCAGKNLSELLDGILSRQQISRDDANCSKPHTDQWHCYTHSQPKILCCIVWLLATSMLHQVSS